MNEQEARAVLAYCAAADTRFTTADAEQARARVQVWADVLSEVDAQFALDRVRVYYSQHHDWSITPGAIRDAWRSKLRADEAKARHAALLQTREQALEAAGVPEPSEAQRAARAAMEAAQGTGPKPARKLARIPRPVSDAVFGARP